MNINFPFFFPTVFLTETTNSLGSPVHEWIVAFHDSPAHPEWWGRFTRSKYRHISLFTYTHGAWLLIDPRLSMLDVRVMSKDEIDTYIAAINVTGGHFLRCTVGVVRCRLPFTLLYCVTVAKRLLGIRSNAITPKQLYDFLVRRGAVPVFEYDPEDLGEE